MKIKRPESFFPVGALAICIAFVLGIPLLQYYLQDTGPEMVTIEKKEYEFLQKASRDSLTKTWDMQQERDAWKDKYEECDEDLTQLLTWIVEDALEIKDGLRRNPPK